MTNPAAYITAAADLRESRVEAATQGPWEAKVLSWGYPSVVVHQPGGFGDNYTVVAGTDGVTWYSKGDPDHIAAEGNPDHVRAEIALWRGVLSMPHDDLCEIGPDPCGCCRGTMIRLVYAAAIRYMGEGA